MAILCAAIIAVGCIFGLTGTVVVDFIPPPSLSPSLRLLSGGAPGSGTATPAKLSLFFTRVELCQDLSLAFASTPPSSAAAFSSPASSGCITVFSATSPLPPNPTDADFARALPTFHDMADAHALAKLSLASHPLTAFATGSFKYGVLHWEPWTIMRATVRTASGLDAFTQPSPNNNASSSLPSPSLLVGPARDAWIKTSGATWWCFATPFSLPLTTVIKRGTAPLRLIFDVINLAIAGNTTNAASLPDIDNDGFGFDAPEFNVIPVPQTPPPPMGEDQGVPGVVDTHVLLVERYAMNGPTTTRVEKEGNDGDHDDNDGSHIFQTRHAPESTQEATTRRRHDFNTDAHPRHPRRQKNVTSAPRLLLTLLLHDNAVFGARLTWAGATNASTFTTRSRLFVAAVVAHEHDGTYDFPPVVFGFRRLAVGEGGGSCRLRASAFATEDGEWKRLTDAEERGGDRRLYNYSRQVDVQVTHVASS